MEGREWKKPSESALVSFSAKKLDGKGAREWMKKKKERKGKRAMKPRRKNGINSLPFFFETRTSKCRVGQKKYSDLYCLKILFDKSAKIFIITYGFINFLLTILKEVTRVENSDIIGKEESSKEMAWARNEAEDRKMDKNDETPAFVASLFVQL